ncbi:MAG: polysaccharide deacetylase family protein [Deltaproteobacteria bacterium]|nr:polysaccharide deacetylase family protein [Deltaproteobacteria bacterium]
MTFDDGPLHCTGQILDILAETNHKATFFVIGRNLLNPKLRDLAVRALREGHDLGNHSYSHPDFSTLSTRRAFQEIWVTHRLIREVVDEAGADPEAQDLFFRFPYGADGNRSNRAGIRAFLAELNYGTAWWDLDTHDWQMELRWFPRSPSRVISALRNARPMDVVLLHDREKTARYLPKMLTTLASMRLVSVPLSDLEFGPTAYLVKDVTVEVPPSLAGRHIFTGEDPIDGLLNRIFSR